MLRNLPSDPYILLSYINTKLRDVYPSLAHLCDDLNISESELSTKLATIGYVYNLSQNKFV